MPTLTVREIKESTCPPDKRSVYLWDDNPTGFGVRVSSGGRKAYIVTYRTHGGVQRFLTFSPTNVSTLDQARQWAKDTLYRVAHGEDPAGEKFALRSGPGMAELRDRHMSEHVAAYTKRSTALEYRRLWKRIEETPFWKLRVNQVTYGDVLKLHAGMIKTPIQANCIIRMLIKAFALCEVWGWRQRNSNPTEDVAYYPQRRRTATASPEEFERLGTAIAEYPNERVKLALKLYLATGCRKTEILRAQFQHVDHHRKMLFLPETKSGGLDGEWVNLPDWVLEEILAAQSGSNGSPFIFPGRFSKRPFAGIYLHWQKIRVSAGLPKLRIHDLRHIFASNAHESGASQRLIASMLRHKHLNSTARYIHARDSVVRDAAIENANQIRDALEGKKKPPTS